ncbi:MAG: DUF3341 domain-containing protein [Halopseudomonas sp.]|uniref:DUF3341 domain-containing protein n=1 Tax=Halopseudomonas sp. TaxID=2901191 RepID=UPI0030029421
MSASCGHLARFASAEALLSAARGASAAGYAELDAYAPFAVPGLAAALGFRERRIGPMSLIAGLAGAAAACWLQWFSAVLAYPYFVGGKPLASWPAFVPVSFAVGIVCAVLAAVLGMLLGNGLPRPYHAVFNDPDFDSASSAAFFLLVPEQAQTDASSIVALLQRHGAQQVRELPG